MDANLFGDFKKLLRVDVMGRVILMPEENTLLRGFQFASPESVSYGRFCWNGTCNNCTVTVRQGSRETKGPACRLDAADGLCVTSISSEIKRLL